jgi:hypothetical protein
LLSVPFEYLAVKTIKDLLFVEIFRDVLGWEFLFIAAAQILV